MESSESTVVSGVSTTSPLLGRFKHGKFATDVPTNAQPTDNEYKMEFKYPNRTLPPIFTRKHGKEASIWGSHAADAITSNSYADSAQ